MRNRAAVDTPLGRMLLEEEDGRLCAARFDDGDGAAATDGCCGVLARAQAQITAYFAGALGAFDLPMAPAATPFETAVRDGLMQIPFGETVSYAQLAGRIGRPGAARAVGRACARNPLLVIVPCHRVIACGGELSGYAAGAHRKRALLAHEAQIKRTENPGR